MGYFEQLNKKKELEKKNKSSEQTEKIKQLPNHFQKALKDEKKTMREVHDSEFWIAICFQTREQKEEYLKKAGLIELGDKYLDGMEVAKVQGISLLSPIPKTLKLNTKKAWTEFVD